MSACPQCYGSGQREGDYPSCGRCGGQGFIGSDTQNRCTSCAGTGHLSSRQWVTCYYCSGNGRDPHAASPKRGAGTPSRVEMKPPRRAAKIPKEGNWGWATVAAAVIVGGWTLFFLLGLYSYETDEEWVPFALAAIAALLGAALWRLAAKVGVFVGVLLFVWIWIEANGNLEKPWMPLALAGGAAVLSLYAWRLAAVAMLGIAGFVLMVVTQDGISPTEVTDEVKSMIGAALNAANFAP